MSDEGVSRRWMFGALAALLAAPAIAKAAVAGTVIPPAPAESQALGSAEGLDLAEGFQICAYTVGRAGTEDGRYDFFDVTALVRPDVLARLRDWMESGEARPCRLPLDFAVMEGDFHLLRLAEGGNAANAGLVHIAGRGPDRALSG